MTLDSMTLGSITFASSKGTKSFFLSFEGERIGSYWIFSGGLFRHHSRPAADRSFYEKKCSFSSTTITLCSISSFPSSLLCL
jgi:hypothetical protein